MYLTKKLMHLIISGVILTISHGAFAIPKTERSMLPFPEQIEAGDEEIAKAALTLELYQDSTQKDLYYYVPPFRIRQYEKGAASVMLHAERVKGYAEANALLKQRSIYAAEYTSKKLTKLETDIGKKKSELNEYLTALEKTIKDGNSILIDIRKSMVAKAQADLLEAEKDADQAQEDIRNHKSIFPSGLGRSYFERVLMILSSIGFSLPLSGGEEPDLLMEKINKGLADVSDSYGGYVSFNAYGGFTKEQLLALRLFKKKYAPNLKIVLLPLDKIEFFALTQTESKNQETKHTNLFSNVKGSGDYLGATITLDTSVSGAMGLASHLAPFILPVGIKAALKRQASPTHAKLSCDFTNGFVLRAKNEIRPKFLIFGKQTINEIKSTDTNMGACSIQLLRGSLESAEYKAIEALHQRLNDAFITRTSLSRQEKEAYYRSVIEQAERKGEKSSNEENVIIRAAKGFLNSGWAGVALEGFSWATDSFWQVSEHDVESLSKLKFTDEIFIQADEVITKDLPTNFCLFYNKDRQAYDRCTEKEEIDAKDMLQSIDEIKHSPECLDVDPFVCGLNRDKAGLTNGTEVKNTVKDTKLPEEL